MKPTFVRRGFVVVPCVLMGFACNTLLDNTPGTLLSNETGAEAGDPSERTDAMVAPPDVHDADPPPARDAGSLDAGACGAGEKSCDGICVKTTDPLYGCGGTSCAACVALRGTPACVGGKCAIGTCDPGYADCNKAPGDGCETSLSSATSCGSCNSMCGASAPNCAPVGGSFQCTTGCGAAAPLLCGKQCTDPTTDVAHCGSCNVACAAVTHGKPSCAGGACSFTCDPLFHSCPGNTCKGDTDPTACGPTCAACPTPANAVPTCPAGACSFTCMAGTADCDRSAATGCEATLASDPRNCGACGVLCAGTCTKGKCDVPADAGSDASSGDAGN